jgi:hypothetical protein
MHINIVGICVALAATGSAMASFTGSVTMPFSQSFAPLTAPLNDPNQLGSDWRFQSSNDAVPFAVTGSIADSVLYTAGRKVRYYDGAWIDVSTDVTVSTIGGSLWYASAGSSVDSQASQSASIEYRNEDGSFIDLSGLMSFTMNASITAAGTAGPRIDTRAAISLWGGESGADLVASQFIDLQVGSTGMLTFSAAGFDWGEFPVNWAEISSINISWTSEGIGDYNLERTFSGLQANFVPAPGAGALVGLAGLVGGRRRRA